MVNTRIMEIISSSYVIFHPAWLSFVTFLDMLLFGCSFPKMQPQNTRSPSQIRKALHVAFLVFPRPRADSQKTSHMLCVELELPCLSGGVRALSAVHVTPVWRHRSLRFPLFSTEALEEAEQSIPRVSVMLQLGLVRTGSWECPSPSSAVPLHVWSRTVFSAFLMLGPFTTVPHAEVTSNHKLI